MGVTFFTGGGSSFDGTLSDATPTLTFKDTDCTDSDANVTIVANATDTGSGSEDVDLTISQQIAGTLTQVLLFDADGEIESSKKLIVTDSGSNVLPSFQLNPAAFSSAPGGLYTEGSNTITLCTNGQNTVQFATNRATFYDQIASDLGTGTTPHYAKNGDTNTGYGFSAADTLDLITGGTARLVITNSLATFVVAPVLPSFTDANRGAAGTAGRMIFNTDDGKINIDDGTNWTLADGTTT